MCKVVVHQRNPMLSSKRSAIWSTAMISSLKCTLIQKRLLSMQHLMPCLLLESWKTLATSQGTSFAQQHMLQKGLKVFGKKGRQESAKELNQLHRQNCFTPMLVKDLTQEETKKAQEALAFLAEKQDKTVKGRMVCNGIANQQESG